MSNLRELLMEADHASNRADALLREAEKIKNEAPQIGRDQNLIWPAQAAFKRRDNG